MIIDVLFIAVKAIMTPIFSLLPTFSLVTTLGLPSVGTPLGEIMYKFDRILPLHEIITMIQVAMTAMLGFFAIYKVANWVWRHLPDLWGFGPGAG